MLIYSEPLREFFLDAIFDAQLLPKDKMTTSSEDRGSHFGDYLYQVIRVYGQLTLSFEKSELYEQAQQLIRENHVGEGEIYF